MSEDKRAGQAVAGAVSEDKRAGQAVTGAVSEDKRARQAVAGAVTTDKRVALKKRQRLMKEVLRWRKTGESGGRK